jgi:nucleoid-associated protein YgaU
MGLITLQTIDSKEEAVLARYRESQRAQQTTRSGATSSTQPTPPPSASAAQRDHVGQPRPRGSRLPEPNRSSPRPTSVTYTVERGDTLRGIADWFYGDRSRAQELHAANRSVIRDPNELEPGTVLRIPWQGGATPLA